MRKATRQPSVSTSAAADDRAGDGQRRGRGRPDAERPAALRSVEGVGDEGQRARDEQGAGGTLGEAEDDQPLEGRRQAAQRGGRREPGQADRVDAAPAVVVGQGAGQDEQRGEDRQVAADDVGLALEDADQARRQLLADVLERRVDDRAVEEDGAGPDDGADDRPALAGGHVGAVSQRRRGSGKVLVDSRPCPDPWRSSAPVNSSPRCADSMPACWPRPGDRARASRSCRPPRTRTARRSSPAGRRWASPISGSSAPRSSRSSCAIVRRGRSRRRPGDRRGRPHLPVGRQARVPARRARGECRRAGADGRPPAGRGARRLFGRGDGPGRARLRFPGRPDAVAAALAGRARVRAGRVGRAALRRLARGVVRAGRAPVAAALGRPRHRRGDGRRRPRRIVAGPRPFAGHGLARAPSRAVSGGGYVPDLGCGGSRPRITAKTRASGALGAVEAHQTALAGHAGLGKSTGSPRSASALTTPLGPRMGPRSYALRSAGLVLAEQFGPDTPSPPWRPRPPPISRA